jgi:hypothetical protein
MISLKEAVKAATESVADIFADQQIAGLRVEEVELEEHDDCWQITLSFIRGTNPGAVAAAFIGGDAGRAYKTVAVRASDGKVLSVKIRQPACSS